MSKHSFRKAVKWAYFMNWGEQGFSALFTFVLASILGPRDFGTVTMAWIYILFIHMLLDQGMTAALVQRKDLEARHLDSVFWVAIGLSVGLTGVSVLCAPWWAAANHVKELKVLIMALSICIPIQGLTVVQQAVLQRDMDFRSLSIRANVSALVGGAVGIGLALLHCGVWSLVGQQVVKDVCALSLLWRLSHWRPRLRFSSASVRELLGFSCANFTAKIGVFTTQYADSLLMGLFFGPVAVGLYRLAFRLISMIITSATSAVQTVSFPAFSRLQDKPNELRARALSCVRLSAILTLPAMAGLAMVSEPLMRVLGDRWIPAAVPVSLLCCVGATMAVVQFTGPLMQATSKPQYLAVLTWVWGALAVAMLITTGFLFKTAPVSVQVIGVAAGRIVVDVLIMAPVMIYLFLYLTTSTVKQLLQSLYPSLVSAATVVGVELSVQSLHLVSFSSHILNLGTLVVLGAMSGIGMLLLTDRHLKSEVLEQVGVSKRDTRNVVAESASKRFGNDQVLGV